MNVEGIRVIDSSQIYKPKKSRYFTPIRLSTNESKKLPTLNRKTTPLEELIKSLDKNNRLPSPERYKIKEILGITSTKNRLLLINSIHPKTQRDRSSESPSKKTEDFYKLWRTRKRTKGHKSVPAAIAFHDIQPKKSPEESPVELSKPHSPTFSGNSVRIKRFTPLNRPENKLTSISKRKLNSEHDIIYRDREEYKSERYSRLDYINRGSLFKPAQKLNDTRNWEVDTELLTGW